MIASYSVAAAIQSASSPSPVDVDCHALLAQAALDQAGHLDVVFDDQNAHFACIPVSAGQMKER